MKRLTAILLSVLMTVSTFSFMKVDTYAAEDEDVYYMGSSFEGESEGVWDGGLFSFRKNAAVRPGVKAQRYGADVSKHQGNINFSAMKNAGLEFVIIRAGYRSGSTGAIFEDPMFKTYMRDAAAAGLKIGVYFYSQAVNEAEAREEANFVAGLIAPYSLQLPVFMDYEWSSGERLGNANLSVDAATTDVRAFFNVIKGYGYSVGLYSSDKILGEKVDAAKLAMQGYPIWAARYGANNGVPSTAPGKYYQGTYDLWQYTSKGTGSSYGVSSSYIDLDLWYDTGSFANADYSYVFEPSFYKSKYPDLAQLSDGEAFSHYIEYGLKEGRSGSPIFNLAIYKNYNQDLVAAFGNDNTKYFNHFRDCGMAEGRTSSDIFHVQSYKNQYADLRTAFGNNLKSYYLHFYECGYREGRSGTGSENSLVGAITTYKGVDYSAVYDYSYYRKKYGDLVAAFGNDDAKFIAHFVECGMSEGRQAKSSFNVYSYKNTYGDLRAAFGNDLKKYYMHYVNCGAKEGRVATGNDNTILGYQTVYGGVDYSAVYDLNYYLANNGDVAAAFGQDETAVLAHFAECGIVEGRQAKATFNVRAYKNTYSDLRAVFGNDLKCYYWHYISCGKAEGRDATSNANRVINPTTVLDGVDYSAVYDYTYYTEHNADVAAVFGNDDVAILRHFVDCGMSEGRRASEDFSLAVYKANYGDLRAAFGNDNKSYYLHYINSGLAEGREAK